MVLVRERSAREPQGLVSHLAQQRNGCGGVEDRVPNGGIHTEVAGVDGANRLRRIHADIYNCGGRNGGETDVVHVKRRLRCAAAILNPKAVHVRFAGDTERRERDRYFLPGIREQRRERHSGLSGAVEQRLHLQQLTAG